MTKPDQSKFKPGDVIVVALDAGEYGYIYVYRGRSVGVIPVISAGIVDKPEELKSLKPQWYFDFVVLPKDKTILIKIGEIHFKDSEQE